MFDQAPRIVALTGRRLGAGLVRQILISETMRLSEAGGMTLGLWRPDEHDVIVRRDQVASLSAFVAVVLHELGHAFSGETDGSLAFEEELTRLLGVVAQACLSSQ